MSGTVFAVGEGVAIITATVGKNTAQSYVTVTLPYRAPSASLLFTFDDGRTSTLTLGASILSDYGFVGTAYVMSDPYFSSTGRFLNVSELDILYNYYGWDMETTQKVIWFCRVCYPVVILPTSLNNI